MEPTTHDQPEYLDPSGHLIGRQPIKTTKADGRVVRAVDTRLYPNLAPELTFHEFLLQVLVDLLEMSWLEAERDRPENDRHILAVWLDQWWNFRQTADSRVEDVARNQRSAEPSGEIQSLIVLAYDAYSLMHCGALEDRLINRLKTKPGFQGARYEMAVAGLFVRAGFRLTWIAESQAEKRAEFTAHHPLTGDTVVVEAKSRVRDGALETKAPIEQRPKLKADITELLRQARQKRTMSLPYLIFIEINHPPTPGTAVFDKEWVTDLQRRVGNQPLPTTESPDSYAVLYVTNFSWHYLREESVGKTPGEEIKLISLHPNAPIKNPQTLDLIQLALSQYGQVPHWL